MRKLNWLVAVVFTLAFQCSFAGIVALGEYGWIDTISGDEHALSWDANSESRIDEMLNDGFIPMTWELWNDPFLPSYGRIYAAIAEGDFSLYEAHAVFFPEITYQSWMSGGNGLCCNPANYFYQDGDKIYGFNEGIRIEEGYFGHHFSVLSATGEWSEYFLNLPTTTASESPLWMIRRASAVPEPTTLGLFAAGLAGLGFLSRRRKQAH